MDAFVQERAQRIGGENHIWSWQVCPNNRIKATKKSTDDFESKKGHVTSRDDK